MSKVRWPFAGLVAACSLLTAAPALAARPSAAIAVAGNCAGDTITARVAVSAPRGALFRLQLLERKTPRAPWAASGRSRRFRSSGGRRSYRFRFNISASSAYAYRLRLSRPNQRVFSKPILASACAPGRQVPDAPLALLLPLSLLVSSSVLLRRRRSG